MKKIGREVLFLKTRKENPRNGEGAFIRLLDGRIMYAYTEYYGESRHDHAVARISAVYSSDEGETWSERRVLTEKDENALNIMSVTLIRCGNGDLGLLYLRKFMNGDRLLCMPYFARSANDGQSFSEPACCCSEDGYYVVNNDRVVRLKSGRLIFPLAYHGTSGEMLTPGALTVCYSDDDGKSFCMMKHFVRSPYNDAVQLQEPGLYELSDGRLWMFCRTAYGHQYQCFSNDGGESFGELTPALRFTSPDSPMQVKAAHGYTLAVFNPLGYSCVRDARESWGSPKRTPLALAYCDDGGLSFVDTRTTPAGGGFLSFSERCRLLEDDMENSYCYPAIMEVNDGFLVAYYHSDNTDACLNATKITKVSLDELSND